MFNAYWEALTFEVPRSDIRPYGWQRCVDTALSSPDDFRTLDEAPPVREGFYCVQPRSCAVLASPWAPAAVEIMADGSNR
jgi:hypothetical protein